LQYKGVDISRRISAEENIRLEDVRNQLLTEVRKNQELSEANDELRKRIDDFQSSIGDENEKLIIVERELAALRLLLGFSDVKGSGITITLDRGTHEFSSIRDTDLLKLVNELKASGAQAISINGERLTAMSEIREAGNLMVINGKKTSEPYIVKAISDKDRLEASLDMPGGITEELKLYMNVKIEKIDELVIEKLSDDGLVIKTDLLIPAD
jgi:uncharacterized protein YlxW (UPF0749 family)